MPKTPSLFGPGERRLVAAISRLIHTNPFLPERIACEREALGRAFVPVDPVLSMRLGRDRENPNMRALHGRAEALVGAARRKLVAGTRPDPASAQLYLDAVHFLLYFRHEATFYPARDPASPAATRGVFGRFREELEELTELAALGEARREDAAHLFACFHQLGRAFHQIYAHIVGRSMPAARLRAAVWESVFTHDMRRYRRALWGRMADVTTLIVGPSGTGKELVARAIGLSRYLPFDPRRGAFPEPHFQGLNISALSPTLVESELFGHRRGAFTGALEDRAGWLETCTALGTVFLDEVGDIQEAIQVKLLRVLQERGFQRLGETRERRFEGKILAATNRDLPGAIAAGAFRKDFYYRLCADVVAVPGLAERLGDCPDELADLVRHLARRIAGEAEAEPLAAEVEAWIAENLPAAYPWPGNVRELEQCVRSVLVRAGYRPLGPGGAEPGLGAAVEAGGLTAEELLDRYCALVHGRCGSYVEAARRLGLDRRTVRARVARAEASGTMGA